MEIFINLHNNVYMQFITFDKLIKNSKLVCSFKLPKNAISINVSCSSFFTIFADDKVIFYGPERTPEDYARISLVKIPNNTSNISISILYCGVPTLDLDEQEFFFGVEICSKTQVLLNSFDLKFYKDNSYISDSLKYSFQRGFVERFDLNNQILESLNPVGIQSPSILEANNIKCSYKEVTTKFIRSGDFVGFKSVGSRRYLELTKEYNKYDLDKELKDIATKRYKYSIFKLNGNKSGLIKLNIRSNTTEKAFVYFDECLINNEFVYGRGTVTNVIEVNLNKGDFTIVSNNVYTSQYFMVIYKEEVEIIPSLILIQNEDAIKIKSTNNKDTDLVLDACRNTYMQNSYDIYTDCPGRERAGWLCDSYFIGIGEKYFSNSNRIEKHFLENFIIGKCPEIHNDKIVPMCFPATHEDGTYIPNWALWFILEIDRYYQDTGDIKMLEAAKDKIINILSFFSDYENEYGLLENLPSWVFIEWSLAGSEDYVKGISFPTNMTYARVLERVGKLYSMLDLIEKSKQLKEVINIYAFDGDYYHDNAYRSGDNKIIVFNDHKSETAQYYAIFFKINKDKSFINKIINEFSANKLVNENGMPKSNVFIGNFLRFLILLENKQYKKLLDEIIPYYLKMAKITKTLWEKDIDDASCNHGLNAAIAPIIDECLKNI